MGIPPGIPPQGPPPYPQSRAQWKAQRAQWKMQAKMQRAAYRVQYRGYSRGSLLGPLFLIVIGVFALLMTTHRINIVNFWQWYGHWWPLILIVAGVLLAVESLALASRSRIRLGGGMVLLLLLLAALGIAAANNHVNWSAVGDQLNFGDGNVNLAQIFGGKHQVREQIAHPLAANGTLIVQNPYGDVTIASGNETDGGQMHLTLDKSVYSNSDSEAKRKLQSMDPLITENGSVVTVHMPASSNQTADMDIVVPASIAVQVQSGHGDIAVRDMQAAVDVSAGHGDVRLTGITGVAQAAMHQGDFSASDIHGDLKVSGHMNDVTLSKITGTATLDGDFFGDVHLETVHGAIHLHSSRTDVQLGQLAGSLSLDGDDLTVNDATGPIGVATHAKDIALRRVTGEVRINNSDGSVEVKALDPFGAMTIENNIGSVALTLPAAAKFSLEAVASDGEVHTDYSLPIQNHDDHSTVSGSVGGGGPLIHITAAKGDITLHKDNGGE